MCSYMIHHTHEAHKQKPKNMHTTTGQILRNVPKGGKRLWSRKWKRHSGNYVKTIEQRCDLQNV